MQLAFEPYIPLALWTPLAVSAAALWAVYAFASRQRLLGWRRVVALALMALAIALPLGILLNPTWTQRLPPPAGKPLLTVLVDESQSMATPDGAAGQTRFAQAAAIAQRVERELGGQFEVELKTFGASVKPVTAADLPKTTPEGEITDLAAGLESSLTDRAPGQAVLLLGDGVHNAGGGAARLRQSAERAKAMAIPVYTTTLGQQTTVRDLEVALNLAEELAFIDQEVPLTVSLRQRGQLAGTAKLTVQLDGKVVESRSVALTADGSRDETFAIKQAKAGLYRYDISAEEVAGEVTSVNNHATLMLRVVDEPVRVALLEGKPYWDTKFLVRTLSADPSVELTSVVRMTAGRFLERRITRPRRDAAAGPAETTAAGSAGEDVSQEPVGKGPALQSEAWEIRQSVGSLLEDAESLKKYQIVILGRDAEAFLTDSALTQLKKWLAQGEGSLVCFRGSPSSQVNQRLGELLPVRWSATRESRFRVQLTESGQALGWMPRHDNEQVLTNLPSLATAMKPEGTKPLAVILATGAGQASDPASNPVISFQPIGNGRVVVLEGAGMWRWAFLPAEFQQHDEVYGRLWRSLTRWLISNIGLLPSQQHALRSDKVTFGSSDIATGTLLTRVGDTNSTPPPSLPQIALTTEASGRTQRFTPTPAEEVAGQYRVVFGKLPEGRYQARIVGAKEDDAGARAAFDVRGNFTERLDVAARTDVMKLIAQRSGGAVLPADGIGELAEKFAAHQSANMPERTLRITAWDRWWVLLAVVAAWGLAWGVRRRSGLV
jgi:hypothetical protein